MSKKATLPDTNLIAQLFTQTLGKNAEAKEMASAGDVANPMTAIYTDDDGEPIAAFICDMKLAASLGAVLTLIPAAAALDAAAQNDLPESIRENLFEVLNIAAKLFRPRGAAHRILRADTFLPGTDVPEGLAARLAEPAARMDVEVTIADYTTAQLSLLTIAPKAA